MSPILFVSSNVNKCAEIKNILGTNIEMSIIDVNVPELQGETRFIAAEKCKQAAKIIKDLKLADLEVNGLFTEDTSLEFRALNGLPGPYIKCFLTKLGPDGLVRLLNNCKSKAATAITTIAYLAPGAVEPIIFQGITHGSIVNPRGSTNFGWDCIFQPDDPRCDGKTYGELSKELKNKISHRFKALDAFKSSINI